MATAAAAAAGPRTYVDFVPPHNLVEESDKETFVIDLSTAGFKKEQLRVQIDKYGRLQISGERPVFGNQWSRFYKDLDVPETCNAGDVRARFEKSGFLHIIMPKLSPPAAAAAAEEPKATAGPKTSAGGSKDDKGAAATGHGAARQTTAAQGEEKDKEAAQQTAAQGEEKDKEEDAGTKRPGDHGEDERTNDDGGDGDSKRKAADVSTAGQACGLVSSRRSSPSWTVLLAVVLALLVGAGLYAKYGWMDPLAEPAHH
ncbi:hypothetical protein GUJ93_ZPchr0006g42415 [Zizania palustris]|uniref:SHSP domain-containing protein n=1 Tax=Zizania palustris TaxID=103762 RepID=A0A8J5T9S2_ZIZPA|nr:hypothetical protein GUJ93_ZPchr0006g42415 [Zizania palustris]